METMVPGLAIHNSRLTEWCDKSVTSRKIRRKRVEETARQIEKGQRGEHKVLLVAREVRSISLSSHSCEGGYMDFCNSPQLTFLCTWVQYRDRNKGLYVISRSFLLLLLNFSAWPCLAVA